ncbi:MAG: SDR family NAD(P)-dependent oxidoreductase [Hyphomonadaceae bacterium]|nr:SDR family NAD(P)-dependent oxidoreductase [Hyphomonadaceae bacterium]
MRFAGQVIIVTGAAGNLGMAIAALLAREGASLALADRRGAASISDTLAITGADVSTREGAQRIASETLARFGRIDGLANTVGTFKMANVVEDADKDWRMLMELNALSALLLSQAVLPAMTRQAYGRIVHIAAGAGLKAFAGASVYSASKAALIRVTEAIAEEHKAAGVTANCIAPGTIDTPQNRAAMPNADASKWVAPADIAAVAAFLLSREAGAVTGATIPVTGRQ